MIVRRKLSILKKTYETNGQIKMFGYDNIHFKTVNLPKAQKFKNLCKKFNLKKLCNIKSIKLNLININ